MTTALAIIMYLSGLGNILWMAMDSKDSGTQIDNMRTTIK
jgi:hypothetical protein